MTIFDFVNKYEGKQVDYDNAYGAQCVDLFRQYSKEVLEIPEHTGTVEGAKDLFLKFDRMPKMQKYFEKVKEPIPGDIVVLNSNTRNKYGHVAIVLYATDKSIVTFEQDGFYQTQGCYINVWSTKYILGFLRCKND